MSDKIKYYKALDKEFCNPVVIPAGKIWICSPNTSGKHQIERKLLCHNTFLDILRQIFVKK